MFGEDENMVNLSQRKFLVKQRPGECMQIGLKATFSSQECLAKYCKKKQRSQPWTTMKLEPIECEVCSIKKKVAEGKFTPRNAKINTKLIAEHQKKE